MTSFSRGGRAGVCSFVDEHKPHHHAHYIDRLTRKDAWAQRAGCVAVWGEGRPQQHGPAVGPSHGRMGSQQARAISPLTSEKARKHTHTHTRAAASAQPQRARNRPHRIGAVGSARPASKLKAAECDGSSRCGSGSARRWCCVVESFSCCAGVWFGVRCSMECAPAARPARNPRSYDDYELNTNPPTLMMAN